MASSQRSSGKKKSSSARARKSAPAFFPPYLIFVFQLTIVMTLIGIILVSGYSGYLLHWNWQNLKHERMIQQALYQEIEALPEVELVEFTADRGQALVDLQLVGQGKVVFKYGVDQQPKITQLGQFQTEFDCFMPDELGQPSRFLMSKPLSLRNGSMFQPWVQYELNSVRELVQEYDQVLSAVQALPIDPATTTTEDGYAILAQPNPEYRLQTEYQGEAVICDLYLETLN